MKLRTQILQNRTGELINGKQIRAPCGNILMRQSCKLRARSNNVEKNEMENEIWYL